MMIMQESTRTKSANLTNRFLFLSLLVFSLLICSTERTKDRRIQTHDLYIHHQLKNLLKNHQNVCSDNDMGCCVAVVHANDTCDTEISFIV